MSTRAATRGEPGTGRAGGSAVQRRVAPGKATLTGTLGGGAAASAVQRRSAAGEGASPAGTSGGEAGVHAAAAAGFGGAVSQLPYHETIQRAFGPYDVSGVAAYTDGRAQRAAEAMGAEAYASGERVAFGKAPDLHTAAHEAAHVVQQRAGVTLAGGVGQVGDGYEQAADEVADAVVRGESAVPLLERSFGGGGGGSGVGGVGRSAAGGGGGPVQRQVPAVQQRAVRTHFDELLRWHGLRERQATPVLTDVLEEADSALAANRLLDERLDPGAAYKALERQGRFQDLLDQLRAAHHPAAAVVYALHPTDDYARVLPEGEPVPGGIPFGVTVPGKDAEAGQMVIYIHEHWISRWVTEDQLGSLLNTIEHEAVHARQGQVAGPFTVNADTKELEAYTREILLTRQKLDAGERLLPTQAQLAKAYEAADSHFGRLENQLSQHALAPYRARWQAAKDVYADVRARLGLRDEVRHTSRFEEPRFRRLCGEYLALGESLLKVAGDAASKPDSLVREPSKEEAALVKDADRRYDLARKSHQELDALAAARLQPLLDLADQLKEDFRTLRQRGPKALLREKGLLGPGSGSAKKKEEASSGPSGSSSSGFLPLLPPPPTAFGLRGPDEDDDSPSSFGLGLGGGQSKSKSKSKSKAAPLKLPMPPGDVLESGSMSGRSSGPMSGPMSGTMSGPMSGTGSATMSSMSSMSSTTSGPPAKLDGAPAQVSVPSAEEDDSWADFDSEPAQQQLGSAPPPAQVSGGASASGRSGPAPTQAPTQAEEADAEEEDEESWTEFVAATKGPSGSDGSSGGGSGGSSGSSSGGSVDLE